MKVTAITLPWKSARLTGMPSCEVRVNGGAGAIRGSGCVSGMLTALSRGCASISDASSNNVRTTAVRMISALQLALEFVHEAPVRSFGNDLVRIRLDHAAFAQPQRVEPDRVFGIVIAPFVIGHVIQRLQCVVVASREPAVDHPSCGACRIACAQVGRLEDRPQDALSGDGVGPDEVAIGGEHAAKILRPRAVDGTVDDHAPDAAGAQL